MQAALFLGSVVGRLLTNTRVSPQRNMLSVTLSNTLPIGRDRMVPHSTGL